MTIKNSKGFSLIELLVGIAIIITAMTIVLAIIVSSFRISGKNTSTESVRQNGSSAINQMSRMIQFADGFVGVTNDASFATTVPVCEIPPSDPAIQPTKYKYLRINFNGSQKTFSCASNQLQSDGTSMIDNNKISVPTSDCYFTCTQDNAAVAPVIGINFDLAMGDESTVNERRARMNFSTKVKMRNQ
jgi:type II secretory pathway pseudopilin PulG